MCTNSELTCLCAAHDVFSTLLSPPAENDTSVYPPAQNSSTEVPPPHSQQNGDAKAGKAGMLFILEVKYSLRPNGHLSWCGKWRWLYSSTSMNHCCFKEQRAHLYHCWASAWKVFVSSCGFWRTESFDEYRRNNLSLSQYTLIVYQ